MKYKIMTKDLQWTIADKMSEKEVIRYWENNVSETTAILDYVIVDETMTEYEYGNDSVGFIEPFFG